MDESSTRILTVVSNLGVGGTERAAKVFAREYASLGADSRIWVTSGHRQGHENLRGAGMQVTFGSQGLAAFSRWQPDIAHLHSHGLTQSDVAQLRLFAPEARLVEQNVFSKPTPWTRELDASFQLSNACLARYISHPAHAWPVVVPYPVDGAAFFRDPVAGEALRESLGIPSGAITVGRVGQPSTYKWSPLVLQLFQRAIADKIDAHLILVGPPPELLADIQRSTHRKRIHVIGMTADDATLRGIYSAMDIFLHAAAQGESFGYVLAEALLCEVPTLTISTPWADNSQGEVIGLSELVARSPQQMYSRLRALMLDPQTRQTYGQRGRRHILENYSSRKVALHALVSAQSSAAYRSGASTQPTRTLLDDFKHRAYPKVVYGAWRWLPRKLMNRLRVRAVSR